MSTIFIIAGLDSSLIRFRGDLIRTWLQAGHRVHAAAPGRGVAQQLAEMGVSYHPVPLSRTGLNPVTDLLLFFALLRLIKRLKPDLLFLYTVKPVIYGSLAARFFPRARVFSMITGLGYVFTAPAEKNRLLKTLVVSLYRAALRRNEKVIFQNPDDEKLFLSLGLARPAQAARVSGSGVNLAYFRPSPPPSGPPRFLLIARLLREKGIYEYIEAARIIKAKHPRATFALIGWAFEKNPSAVPPAQVERWRREKVVEIYGETADVRPHLAACSVYVLPSYREGTPRTVLEAMATGRAVITTAAPGCRETVAHGITGFLVPVADAAALAEAMEKFTTDPDLAPALGAAGRLRAAEKYDVHRVNERINRVIGLA